MPLVDLLNHHPRGERFLIDARHLWIQRAQPARPEAQCFACYGPEKDVLDMAMGFGHADPHIPYARSAPLEVELAGIGRLRVLGLRMKSLHPMSAPQVTLTESALTLSHVVCDRDHPERLPALLRLAILGAARQRGMTISAGEHAVEQALLGMRQANLDLLATVRTAASQSADLPVGALLAEAAALQARIIDAVVQPRPAQSPQGTSS